MTKKSFLPLLIITVLSSVLLLNTLMPFKAAAASGGEVMFILDASSSMLAKDGDTTRIEKAKTALNQVVSSLPADTQVGLRVYGSQVPDTDKTAGCQDSRLVSRPAANNAAQITASVNNIQAKGWTLMGKALQDVQADFTGSGPKSVILISDGIDTCSPPDACEVAKNLQAMGTKVKVNTLGLLVNNSARAQLTCIADNSGGNYYDINNLDRLQSTLSSLTAREVSLFTASGVPIKGSLRVDQAPQLLANTNYTDTFTIPQELYYGFEALPKQKITITVKAVNRDINDTSFNRFDRLRLTGFVQATNKKLKASSPSTRFAAGDVTTATYEIDTANENFTKATPIAVQVSTSNDKLTGTTLPLEISVTTEGGETQNNQSVDKDAQADAADTSMSPVVIVLLTLLGVAVLAIIAYVLKRFVAARKRRKP